MFSIATICACLAAPTTPAQQFSSGAATSRNSPSALTAPDAASVRSGDPSGLALSGRTVQSSLEEADRAHTESTRRLQAEYRSTTDADERAKLSEELQRVITEHFEIRQKRRAQELEELQMQIRRLQELHDRREQEKNQIISDRVRQILRDAEGLGWGSSDAADKGDFGMPSSPSYPRSMRSATSVNVPR
jgi:hypothetical protein